MERLRKTIHLMSEALAAFSESVTDYEQVLQTVARAIPQVVPDTCIISLASDDGTTMTPMAVQDADRRVVDAFAPILGVARPLSEVARTALTATAFEPMLDPATLRGRIQDEAYRIMESAGVRGILVVPMRSRGELLGLVSVLRHQADLPPLDEIDREVVEHLADHAALVLANARLFRKLERSEELRASEARAAEASRFVDAILENIPDMVFVKDAKDLRFVRFNRAGEELLGFSRADLIGKNDYDFFPKSEADFFIQKDRETLAGKHLVDIAEEPILTKRGQRWLHTKKVPLLDEHGEPRYLLGISHDITERKHATAALAEAKEKAEAANKELEAFSYSVAHDLRAPLRALDGFAQALLDDYAATLDAAGQRHLERIRGAAQRMATLIDDLLRLSRVTRAELRRERVDLAALARAAFLRLEKIEPGRKVQLVVDNHLPVHGDPKLLEIVLDNLLDNAWKFTERAEPARIEVGMQRTGNERVYFVRDNGAGFDMAYADKLFGVFQRLHPAHEYSGTGIGLATVKRIIERHGGRVWAEAAVGQGATFFFTLSEAP